MPGIATFVLLSLVIAKYLGAAPNAIAYDAKQFTTGEFFMHGIPTSIILIIVLGIALLTIWPMLGMPILIK